MRASRGGNMICNILEKYMKKVFSSLIARSMTRLTECPSKYISRAVRIVSILLIKVERKSTIESNISILKKVKRRENKIISSICIPLDKSTQAKKTDWSNNMRNMTIEKPKNLPKIKSNLVIGLDNIRKIVFHSISLNSSWLPTKRTHMIPNISIIPSQKSTIILFSSHIARLPSIMENKIKRIAKKIIKYKNLFLTISLKVLMAMFSI